MSDLVTAMCRPSFYQHRPESVEFVETRISWVFLAGERAYKVKKPVVFPFLDYGDPARRRELCEEEVRLNRRLARDLYLGVRGLVPVDGEWRLTGADDPARGLDPAAFDRLLVGEFLGTETALDDAPREAPLFYTTTPPSC